MAKEGPSVGRKEGVGVVLLRLVFVLAIMFLAACENEEEATTRVRAEYEKTPEVVVARIEFYLEADNTYAADRELRRLADKIELDPLREAVNSAKEAEAQHGKYWVIANKLKTRDAPEGNQIGLLSYSEAVRVSDVSGNWYRISPVDQAPAWVHRDYLAKEKPAKKTTLYYASGGECGKFNDRSQQMLWIAKAQESVRGRLRDSSGVKFPVKFFSCGEGGLPMVCGQVNAKNGFGGYTGPQGFVSAGRVDLTYLAEEVDDFQGLWVKMCQRPGVSY